jgi:hypothetical protein
MSKSALTTQHLFAETFQTQHVTTFRGALPPVRRRKRLVENVDLPVARRLGFEVGEYVHVNFMCFSHNAEVIGECECAKVYAEDLVNIC